MEIVLLGGRLDSIFHSWIRLLRAIVHMLLLRRLKILDVKIDLSCSQLKVARLRRSDAYGASDPNVVLLPFVSRAVLPAVRYLATISAEG